MTMNPAPKEIGFTTVRIQTQDGYALGGRMFDQAGDACLIILGATGVPQYYYQSFAQFFASRGVSVLTFDYRGVGESIPAGGPAAVKGGMTHWMRLDSKAALDVVLEKWAGRRIWAIGHSIGGQAMGLVKSLDKAERAIMVASQLPYWRDYHWNRLPLVWLASHVLMPGLSRLLGYFPGSRLGLGEDLPKEVAMDWGRWLRSRNYLFDYLSSEDRKSYDTFAVPILAYKLMDDILAQGEMVEKLLRFYPSARPLIRTVAPEEFGVAGIGHLGVFRSRFRENLWNEMFNWFSEGVKPGTARPLTEILLSRKNGKRSNHMNGET